MALRQETIDVPAGFDSWIRETCERATPPISRGRFNRLYVRVGGEKERSTTDRWYSGESACRADEARIVVKALDSAPETDFDVYGSYIEWLRRFKQSPSGRRGHLKAVAAKVSDGASDGRRSTARV